MPAIVWATLRRCCSWRRRAETDDTGSADFSVVAALLLSVDAGMVLSWWLARRPLPRLDGNVAIGGLTDGVIVDRNARGGRGFARDLCRIW
jgi:hypothetical protein